MPTTWMDSVLRQTRRAGTFPYPHQAAVFLNNPIRRALGRPGSVIDGLHLAGTERVLEIGPGPGYFSVEIARRLTAGRLELFDLQPEMLVKARKALATAGFVGIGAHSGDAGQGLPFPDASFDIAFLAAVLGEVPDKATCVAELHRVVKVGGSVVFVEAFPDPDRLGVNTLRELVEPAGFTLDRASGGRFRDVVRFRRKA